MFVIFVLATLACLGFRKTLRQKGYPYSRLWVYPVLIASGVLLLQFLLGTLVGLVVKDPRSLLAQVYPGFLSLVSALLMFALIAIAWRQVKALPPKEGVPPPEK